MSFYHKYKTLRSGNLYDLHALPEMSTHEEETTVAVEMNANEWNGETNTGFSPDMIEEKIKATLETPPCSDLCPKTNDGQGNSRQLGQKTARTRPNRHSQKDPEPLEPHG